MQLLGVIAYHERNLAEAIALQQYCVGLVPNNADFRNNLGTALALSGQSAEAEQSFRLALQHRPGFLQAWNNLANALREQGKLEEAESQCRAALDRYPNSAETYNALGTVLERGRRIREALECFDAAVRLSPSYVQAHVNRALAWLMLGDHRQGWPEYEWRLRQPGKPFDRPWGRPRWDGAALNGRTILLHTEGGMGNVIQFSRFTRQVHECGGRVLLECPGQMVRLLSTLQGVSGLVPAGAPLPQFDVQASLVSLPAILRIEEDCHCVQAAYLRSDPRDREACGRSFAQGGELSAAFRVGIAWQGNPNYPGDATRSVPLEAFVPIARTPRVRLISLQRVNGLEQLSLGAVPLTVVSQPPEASDAAFTQVAAIMQHLDLVITSDTSIAHLAGAIGVRTWVALPYDACWRWQLNRTDSPWYPTMRLFRQQRQHDWQGLFEQITQALGELLGHG